MDNLPQIKTGRVGKKPYVRPPRRQTLTTGQIAVAGGLCIVGVMLIAVVFALPQQRRGRNKKQVSPAKQVAQRDTSRPQAKFGASPSRAAGRAVPSVPGMDSLLGDTLERMQNLNRDLQRPSRPIPETPRPPTAIPQGPITPPKVSKPSALRKRTQATNPTKTSPEPEVAKLPLKGANSANPTATTQKTYYPNGQLHEEISVAGNRQEGISRAWYSNGDLRDEMHFSKGVLTRGAYFARSGKPIFEYQMDRDWLAQSLSHDFSRGPDGQSVRPYSDTQELVPQPDPETGREYPRPSRGWPVVTMEGSVYTDDDLGEVFHGVVKWKTLNGVRAHHLEIKDATSMTYEGTGSLAYVAGRRHGPLLLSYPSGKRWVVAAFANNLLHGTATLWYENGRKKEEIPFVAGQWDGNYRAWHENGQKALEVAFARDNRNGIRREWNDGGQMVAEGLFRNDLKEGPHKTWWPNGQLATEQIYEKGQLHGRSREWNEQGLLTAETAHESTVLLTADQYKARISDPKQRTCAAVWSALERAVGTGRLNPDAEHKDRTIQEMDAAGGITVSSGRTGKVLTHSREWTAAGAFMRLNAWEELCGPTKAVPLRSHGEAFNDASVENLGTKWGRDLLELAYPCVDGTLYVIGQTKNTPGVGTLFLPREIMAVWK